jgi:hypothetical protein
VKAHVRDDSYLELLIEGQKRAVASAYQKSGDVITALAKPDSLSELGKRQGEDLMERVYDVLAQLRWRFPKKFGHEPLIDKVRREQLHNPSLRDQQLFLETLSVKRRFGLLAERLTAELESQQLKDLLRKRVKRFMASQFPSLMDNGALLLIGEAKNNPVRYSTHSIHSIRQTNKD